MKAIRCLVWQVWWAWPLWFQRFCYFSKWPKFFFGPWTIVHGGQKIELAQKIHSSRELTWNACKPILVGVAISGFGVMAPFMLASKTAKIFPSEPWAIVHGGQKIELAQKIQASRGWCEMHANQFWWAWPLQFRRFCFIFRFPSKQPKFSFRPWTIVHGGQKIESAQKIHASRGWREMHANQFLGMCLSSFVDFASFLFAFKIAKISLRPWTIVHGGQKIELAQKIHASRGWCEMHANQFWWAWPLRFQRFCSFFACLQNGQNFPSDHGL